MLPESLAKEKTVQTIFTGDKKATTIIRKKTKTDKQYRLSSFTYPFSEDGVHLLQSTLTGMTVSLANTEWAVVERARKQPIIGAELTSAGLEELVRFGFLVEKDTDDYEQYRQAIAVLKLMSREGQGTKSYTILPTTGCNARCVYCYEEGMPVYSMTEETADRVVEFIDKTRSQDKIKLIWFGGEPLAGSRMISRICKSLNERNIPFRSKLITNATLMTFELLEEAVSLWHLETAQVSVDGERNDYEARKQYVNPTTHHYETMMDAVGRMLDKGIRVTFRCNYDGENLERLSVFIEDVKSRFGCLENLSVYPAMLFQAKAEKSSITLYRNVQALNAYLRELGLRKKDRVNEPYRLKLNLCGADNGDKSVVIAPDGKLYHCEHLLGNASFGSIYDSQTELHSDVRVELPADERCRTCCFLPLCTPFFKNGCPDYFEYCHEFRQIETEEALRRLIADPQRIRFA